MMALMELSQATMVGFSRYHTMMVTGMLKNHPVIILMDSKATHNFITHNIIVELAMKVTPTRPYPITIRDE